MQIPKMPHSRLWELNRIYVLLAGINMGVASSLFTYEK